MASHAEIVQKYAERQINKRTNTVEWTGRNVFCDGNTLYSYGRHFPMAIYLGEEKSKPLFLKNGDSYSSSTSRHQSMTQGVCAGPTASASALQSAGVDFEKIKREDILFYWEDFRQHCYRDSETGKFYLNCNWHGKHEDSSLATTYVDEWQPPKQGMFVSYRNNGNDRFVSGCWHVLGTLVIEHNDRYLLSSLDEGSYFVSVLPQRPRSVNHAFQILKPKEVRKAERDGLEVKRQGEWFFVPTGREDREQAEYDGRTQTSLRDVSRPSALPFRDQSDNRHVCRNYAVPDIGVFARGKVYHRSRFDNRITGEHQTVNLGDEWHQVYHNTELASWSQGGRFD